MIRAFLSPRPWLLLAAALALALSALTPAPAQAQDSQNIPFGSDGTVTTAIGSGSDHATAVALQSDGKIVAAGRSHNGTDEDFALARYNPDGSLDTGFGTGGTVTTPIGAGNDNGTAVAVQSDGKIVMAGYTHNGSDEDIALARYNPDGSLDTNFGGDADGDGNKDGWVTTKLPGHAYAQAMAIQPDGKIVAAGYSQLQGNFDFALARYTSDGELDAPPTETIFPWSTSLTAQAVYLGYGCGYRTGQPQCADSLTDRVITYQGVDYTIELVHVAYAGGTLQFIMDNEPPASLRTRLRLKVGDREFSLTDDNLLVSRGIADDLDGDGVNEWTNTAAWVLIWTGTGLEWSAGDSISLSLDTPPGGL